MSLAVCTIIAKNYLAYARVLMASVARWAPGARRIVVLVDQPDGCFDPAAEPFEVVPTGQLPIPDSRWFHFKYSVLELATAVKPYALEHIFRTFGVDRVIYFDPDIRLYAPLEGLLEALERSSILLTPHLTAPLEDALRPGELDILRSGSFNLGFLALRDTPDTRRFLEWWQVRLYDQCVVDLARGLFVDQRWMDLAPGLFPGVRILRDPGFNVAYWNLPHRAIEKRRDGWHVNGRPLCFFHFSGLDLDSPERLSRHQNRLRLSDLGEAQTLVREYCRELRDAGYEACRCWPYSWGRFANGLPIPDLGRPLHHEAPELLRLVQDPFSDEGYRGFLSVWNQPVRDNSGPGRGITRLAYRVYRTRDDVQAAMPDIFEGDLLRFLNWLVSSGQREHALDAALVLPARNALQSADDCSAASGPVRLTRLARMIYEARPDLQNFFPDPNGRNGRGFLLWILTYGRAEYGLDEGFLAPVREEWDRLRASAGRCGALWWSALRRGAGLALAVRGLWGGLKPARRFSAALLRARADVHPTGLNLVGYLHSEMGVGEGCRCTFRAAQAAGVAVSLRRLQPSPAYREREGAEASVPPGQEKRLFPVNLLCVNADQTAVAARLLSKGFFRNRYNIGYWAWELEDFPDRWVPHFRQYQEIWTPSTFCQEALARKSPVPVLRIPHAIELQPPGGRGRGHFGLPARAFIYLAAFDMLSVFERKNPLAVARAFAQAFPGRSDCHLVFKVNNPHWQPEKLAQLHRACQGLPVTFIEQTLERQDTDALLECCDCLVSLHRAEGFGLVLAEAMYLGKPVVSTAYSGNADFTRPGCAFLVDYRLRPVGPGCDPYDPDRRWADPDEEDAIRQLRLVHLSPDLRARVAAAGQRLIRDEFSPAAVGRKIRERLEVPRT